MSEGSRADGQEKSRRKWSADFGGATSEADRVAKTLAIYADHADPWNLSSEQFRFAETNRIARGRFGFVRSLLEIACGEGYQSVWLSKICDRLVGTDISPHALERARGLVPDATFLESRLPDLPLPAQFARFDLAVACDVLYSIDDIDTCIARMRALAPRGLVSALTGKWRRLGPALEQLPNLSIEDVSDRGRDWRVATWSDRG